VSAAAAVATLGWALSAALAVVLARRRTAARRRGDRLAGVVHELRGPLHAAGMIAVAARRGAPPDTGRALTALEVELGRLALAVRDLDPPVERRQRRAGGPAPGADHPRPDAEAHGPVACDAAALVADLAPGWRLVAAASGRQLRVSAPLAPLWVAAERLRLAQALGNLVANALEHGAGSVDVQLAAGPGGAVRAEVRDAGPGLPASVAALVARPPDPGRARGRGLGIAARIAADAGGRLRSAPAARGARLVLDVPRASVAGMEPLPNRPVAS
jgi:signal transduction histidine kinase